MVRNRTTGRRRRGTVRRTNRDRRSEALDVRGRDMLRMAHLMQVQAMYKTLAVSMMSIALASVWWQNQPCGPGLAFFDSEYGHIALFLLSAMSMFHAEANVWHNFDLNLADIPLTQERLRAIARKPHAYRRIADFTDDDDARKRTLFSIRELRTLLEKFDLGRIVRIPAGSGEGPHVRHYEFTGEELFLFGLMKQASGKSNVAMCEDIVGGEPRRWSAGYPWLMSLFRQGRQLQSCKAPCCSLDRLRACNTGQPLTCLIGPLDRSDKCRPDLSCLC